MKAKTIDRLQLTKQKFARNLSLDNIQLSEDLPPEPNIHGDICPNCGAKKLIHESGCVKCLDCSWSACG